MQFRHIKSYCWVIDREAILTLPARSIESMGVCFLWSLQTGCLKAFHWSFIKAFCFPLPYCYRVLSLTILRDCLGFMLSILPPKYISLFTHCMTLPPYELHLRVFLSGSCSVHQNLLWKSMTGLGDCFCWSGSQTADTKKLEAMGKCCFKLFRL